MELPDSPQQQKLVKSSAFASLAFLFMLNSLK